MIESLDRFKGVILSKRSHKTVLFLELMLHGSLESLTFLTKDPDSMRLLEQVPIRGFLDVFLKRVEGEANYILSRLNL